MSIFVTHLSIRLCEYLQWKHVLIYSKWTPKKHGSWNQIEGYATTHVYTIGIVIAHYGNPYETASLKLDVVGLLFCSKRITQTLKYKTSRSFSHGFFPCLCFSMSFPHAFFPCFFVTLLPCLHWKTVDPSSPDNMRQKGTVVAPHRHHRLRRDWWDWWEIFFRYF